jgi:hypothetical protein
MSHNKSLDRYLELYSKYINARVGVHNQHVRFVEYLGLESYYRLREFLVQLPKLEHQMKLAARDAVKEQKEIARLEKRERIKEKQSKKKKRDEV